MSKSESKLKVIPHFGGIEYLSAKLKGKRFPVHFHDTFVFQLISSGADSCCTNNMVARPGEAFVHFPFATHDGGTVRDGWLKYQAIYPTRELVAELTGIPEREIHSRLSWVSDSAKIVESLENLFHLLNSKPSEKRLIRALRDSFKLILEHSAKLGCRPVLDVAQKLEAARKYLVENSAYDVSIETLSQHCDLSKFHLIRSFKKRFGITPRQFLISQRVAVAKQLMTSGMPLSQAAFSAGFNDQSHLTRCFKRLTTLSPGQFRNASLAQ